MKEMKCLDCNKTFMAENPGKMMETMMPHYMSDHKEIMEGKSTETREQWMARFSKEWKKAKEV